MREVIIIGGGLGGLISSILLSRSGIPCTVIEKNSYPFHKVCGEYISNEVLPFLKSNDLVPDQFDLPRIDRFQLSSVSGRDAYLKLDLGGFGISRYNLDRFLFEKAQLHGARFILNASVDKVTFDNERFAVNVGERILLADVVVGAFGKRSKLDLKMKRSFTRRKSPYLAVKYHIKTDFPNDLISLHNFTGGYCGISNVENGVTNLCYLANRKFFRQYGNIQEFERNVLCKNPLLKYIFNNSEFIFDRPLTINEISFETKDPVEQHMLMTGDAAGMIAPLCGNGMAMAIHSAKIASDHIVKFCKGPDHNRGTLEYSYAKEWMSKFAGRIQLGRQMQKLFGSPFVSNLSVNLAIYCSPIAKWLVRNSHGDPF